MFPAIDSHQGIRRYEIRIKTTEYHIAPISGTKISYSVCYVIFRLRVLLASKLASTRAINNSNSKWPFYCNIVLCQRMSELFK